MQKVLGQDIKDSEARKDFLIDNCDGVEEMDYHKSFDPDYLEKMKTEFANKHIRIAYLEEQIADFKEEINKELKPLKEEVKLLREDLKSKGRTVHEKVFRFLDEEDRMVGFYNEEGILVSSRPARRDELQKTVFADLRKDGTNN